jgi:hypothetical protein
MHLSDRALDKHAADQAKTLARGLKGIHSRQHQLMLVMICRTVRRGMKTSARSI